MAVSVIARFSPKAGAESQVEQIFPYPPGRTNEPHARMTV
jgi:hypothetical protein